MPSTFDQLDPALLPPVLLADPHKDIAPHTYRIVVRRTKCACCGSEAELCETYAITHLKSRWERKYVTNARPLERPMYKLPIELVYQPATSIPFCHKCPDPQTAVSALPLPPLDQPKTLAPSWIKDEKKEEKKPRQSKPSTAESSTDDLLKGIDL